MDDFIDPFLSSTSWPDMNISSRTSWTDSIASQSNDLLTDSVEPCGGDEKNAPICMIPSAHIRNVATEDLDFHDGNLKYLAQHELPGHHSHSSQHDTETRESNFALNEVYESNSASGSYGRETLPHSALTISSSIESNGSEPSKFAQSLGDAHSISSVPSMWPPSYLGVSTFIEQGKLPGFGFQGVESDADVLGTTYIENGTYPRLNNSAVSSVHDSNGLPSANLPNFNFGQQMKMTNGGLHPHQQLQEQNGLHNLHLPSFSGMQAHRQLSQSTEGNNLKHQTDHSSGVQQHLTPANNNVCNGAAKPRVRARRGQATDPHSIAERLRREKIAERMKNLQELVPNSNKADKASMLDEIIDYVKFLQLQVKVLSMSRLGAAGAVLPLITDVQVKGSGNLNLSSSVGHGAADLSEVDNLALEQEVVKLMESNVTSAMQYLQNKGVCLMPIALASAISSQKGSAAIPPNRTQPDVNHGVIKQEDALKPI